MPDYNADKDRGMGKKKWVVQPTTKNIAESIMTGKGELKTDDLGRMLIKDEALAREIQKDHRRDLTVSRIFDDDPADRGHNYFFGQLPAIPWHRYDKNGRRIKEPEQTVEQPGEDAEGLDELEPYDGEGIA